MTPSTILIAISLYVATIIGLVRYFPLVALTIFVISALAMTWFFITAPLLDDCFDVEGDGHE